MALHIISMRDPGKRVDTRLTTAEWKAFRIAAKSRGLTVGLAARLAIQDWTSVEHSAQPVTPAWSGK